MSKRTLEFIVAACLAANAPRITSVATAATSATVSPAAAENPFLGEWKLDSSKSRMPDEMKVESKGGNKYAFDFGAGVETIVADGTAQPGLYDSFLSAKIEAPDTWIVARTSKKDGRLMLRATWKLSVDGSTLTDYYREFESDGSTVNVSMDYVYQRTGPTASNHSGFAADWQSVKETINTPVLIGMKPFQGDGLSITNSMQRVTRNVKFDGKDYPNEGSNSASGMTSSIERRDERTLILTDKQNGKEASSQEISVSPDGKLLTITMKGRDKPIVMVFNRQ
jgi:hypothetical protein